MVYTVESESEDDLADEEYDGKLLASDDDDDENCLGPGLWAVEEILEKKGSGKEARYLIKWRGHPSAANTGSRRHTWTPPNGHLSA